MRCACLVETLHRGVLEVGSGACASVVYRVAFPPRIWFVSVAYRRARFYRFRKTRSATWHCMQMVRFSPSPAPVPRFIYDGPNTRRIAASAVSRFCLCQRRLKSWHRDLRALVEHHVEHYDQQWRIAVTQGHAPRRAASGRKNSARLAIDSDDVQPTPVEAGEKASLPSTN